MVYLNVINIKLYTQFYYKIYTIIKEDSDPFYLY